MNGLHDARVEAACAAFTCETREEWEEFDAPYKNLVRLEMTDALAAADAVVTVEMIAEVLADHSYGYSISGFPLGCECGHDQGEDRHAAHQAAYVLALLRGGEER